MTRSTRVLRVLPFLLVITVAATAAQTTPRKTAPRPTTAKPRPAAAAAPAVDPFVGVWRLNPAKSKFESGGPPKNFVRTYEDRGGGVLLMTIEVTGDRGVTRSYLVYKRDGKEYPEAAIGTDSVRFVTVRALDARTEEVSAGKTTLVLAVSADGRTMTQTQSGTSPQGKPFTNTVVYDKQ